MRKLGWPECDVVEIEGDDLTATALGIALNRTGELATWDEATLGKLLSELRDAGPVEGIGSGDDQIDALLAELGCDDAEVEDDGPDEPPEDPVSRTGDTWVLGTASCAGTAPPSRTSSGSWPGPRPPSWPRTRPTSWTTTGERPNDSGKGLTDTYREIDIKDADGFFRAVFTNILAVLGPKAAIYTWPAHKRTGVIQWVWEDLGILDHQQIILGEARVRAGSGLALPSRAPA